jgi:hypothetical protein
MDLYPLVHGEYSLDSQYDDAYLHLIPPRIGAELPELPRADVTTTSHRLRSEAASPDDAERDAPEPLKSKKSKKAEDMRQGPVILDDLTFKRQLRASILADQNLHLRILRYEVRRLYPFVQASRKRQTARTFRRVLRARCGPWSVGTNAQEQSAVSVGR